MTIQSGAARRLAFKKQSALGTPASGASGFTVRRVDHSLNLSKDTYMSEERRSDFQVADSRHGLRRVAGDVNGELYVGSWELFFAALCRRDFSTVTPVTSSAGDGFTTSSSVLTRAAGASQSFITDGIRIGQIVRLTNMSETSLNSRNFAVTAVTATTITLSALDGAAIADQGSPDESATLTVTGQVTYIPTTGHTSDYFTFDDYAQDLDISQVYEDCKVGGMAMTVPPTGIVNVTWNIVGLDQTLYTAGNSPVLTNPTEAGTNRALAAVPGKLLIAGSPVAVATGFSLNVDLGLEAPAVIASDTSPDVFYGKAARVTGQISVFFESHTDITRFRNETEFQLHLVLEAPGTAPRDFVSIFLPRVKINSAAVGDEETGQIVTMDFEALLKATATGYESTTLYIQDSSLS